MLKKFIKYNLELFVLFLLITISYHDKLPFNKSFSQPVNYPGKDSAEIVFVSDTQQPRRAETLYLKENQNEKATGMIFKDIEARKPLALFLLGDLVSLSHKESKWSQMDDYLASCKNQNIPCYALLGNHEYMWNAKKGEENFQKRFPENVSTGYLKVVDSIAVVLLNSNFKKLTKSQYTIQQKYYEATLAALDTNPAIQYIIVACHHSPYSNSKIVGSSAGARENFVPLFIKSKKCKLFLSGHSHNFEYFKHEGKDFLVIGGGGGLNQPLNDQPGKLPDLSPDYKPMFHYLTLKRFPGHLQVLSRRLKDDFSEFEDGTAITILNP
jgi:predicted MPP superfamily phosphohydrolase